MSAFIEELKWREMIHDIMPGTDKALEREGVIGYVGFDPTAQSLHIGNLVPIMLLSHFQRAGHKPLALVGGATGMVGDPSGKKAERQLLSEEELKENTGCIKAQLEKFLSFDGENAAEIVNNYDWFREVRLLKFLRDTGKHLTVSYMMGKDSVKTRLGTGLSFAEFSYQLIQGYDFYHLKKERNCILQMGGSDQWGNITAGTELIHRMGAGEAFALTCPLITKADGTKFGKSGQGENIWLDPKKTSPSEFYQYWLNVADEDVYKWIRIFSLKPHEEIEALEAKHTKAPHLRPLQKALAEELTIRVHSKEELDKAKLAPQIRSGRSTRKDPGKDILSTLGSADVIDVPATGIVEDYSRGLNIVDLLAEKTKVFPSTSEARRMLRSKAVFLNNKEVDESYQVSKEDLQENYYLLVQKGKKKYYHLSVFFDWFLHDLFHKEEFKLELHPKLPGTQKKPDYLVKGNGVEFYLEATVASGKPESERARENREDILINYLVDKIESPNPWWLEIEELTWKTNNQPSNKKIKQYLENKVKAIDPVRDTNKVYGVDRTDKITYEDENIKLVIYLLPKSKGSGISWGMGPSEPFVGGSENSIIKAIEKKKLRYGELDKPYLICLNVTDERVDGSDIESALYYALEHLFLKKQNTRVSAVFITCVFPNNPSDFAVWLFRNPDASKELPLKFKHQKVIEMDPRSAEAYYNRGIVKSKSGDYSGAIKDFDKAIELKPRSAEAYNNRGVAKKDLKDYLGAIKDYDKAIEINPQYAGAYSNRGVAKSELTDYLGAIKDYDKAIEINPRSAEAYNNRGVAKSELTDYLGAIKDYDKAIEINPQDAGTYIERGNAKSKLEDYPGAIKDYDKAIEINPQDAGTYIERGNAKSKLEDYPGAIKDYDKAIEINPQYAGAYSNRGVAKSELTDYLGAIKDYDKAIEINPQFADAYCNRGGAKGKLRDYSGAIKDFNEAIKFNPRYADAYSNRGVAKSELTDYLGAIKDYDKAIELNPRSANAYSNRGFARMKSGDYPEAIKDYDKAIEINPRYANAYNNRGFARMKSGDYPEAIKDYDKAIEIDSRYAEVYNNRGVAKMRSEDYLGAIKDYDKAIEINPQFAEAYYNRVIAKMKSEDYTGAIEDFDKAVEINPQFAEVYNSRRGANYNFL